MENDGEVARRTIYKQSVCPATGPAGLGCLSEMKIAQAKPPAGTASNMIYTSERWHGLLTVDSERSVVVEKRVTVNYYQSV